VVPLVRQTVTRQPSAQDLWASTRWRRTGFGTRSTVVANSRRLVVVDQP
jgi:hypothetical protein